eukprot:1155785-Pelagomonas_calceolata.AAC.1
MALHMEYNIICVQPYPILAHLSSDACLCASLDACIVVDERQILKCGHLPAPGSPQQSMLVVMGIIPVQLQS